MGRSYGLSVGGSWNRWWWQPCWACSQESCAVSESTLFIIPLRSLYSPNFFVFAQVTPMASFWLYVCLCVSESNYPPCAITARGLCAWFASTWFQWISDDESFCLWIWVRFEEHVLSGLEVWLCFPDSINVLKYFRELNMLMFLSCL